MGGEGPGKSVGNREPTHGGQRNPNGTAQGLGVSSAPGCCSSSRENRWGTHLEGKGLPKVRVQCLPMHLRLMSPALVWQQVNAHIWVRGATQVQGCQPLRSQDAHQQLQVLRFSCRDPDLSLSFRAVLGTHPSSHPPDHSGSHSPASTAVVLDHASLLLAAQARLAWAPAPLLLAAP